MNELPEREVAVFNAARRLTAEERAVYLDKACGSDAALRRRVEELLQVGETSAYFLEQSALAEADAPMPAVFDHFSNLLRHLSKQPAQAQTIFGFEIKWFQELGLKPTLFVLLTVALFLP